MQKQQWSKAEKTWISKHILLLHINKAKLIPVNQILPCAMCPGHAQGLHVLCRTFPPPAQTLPCGLCAQPGRQNY